MLLVYKVLNGMAPQYITDLLSLRLNMRTLKSSSQEYLTVPATKLKTYGDSFLCCNSKIVEPATYRTKEKCFC